MNVFDQFGPLAEFIGGRRGWAGAVRASDKRKPREKVGVKEHLSQHLGRGRGRERGRGKVMEDSWGRNGIKIVHTGEITFRFLPEWK